MLRKQGFALYGVTLRRYSRSDLPAPFEYEFYAQMLFGQPYQGDAVYLRDLAPPHLGDLANSYPDEKLLKLACLYELFRFADCAAEMLNVFAPTRNAEQACDSVSVVRRGRSVLRRVFGPVRNTPRRRAPEV